MDKSAAKYISDFLFEFLPGLLPKPIDSAFGWDDPAVRCAQLHTELGAYYDRLYGLTRDELRYTPLAWIRKKSTARTLTYMICQANHTHTCPGVRSPGGASVDTPCRALRASFSGKSFRVLKED